jgi:hypothetical protein
MNRTANDRFSDNAGDMRHRRWLQICPTIAGVIRLGLSPNGTIGVANISML